MKKFYLVMVAVFATFISTAQSTERNMVILEIATGTWCQYCPGAAKAADQLISEGKSVAVIENHNGDAYSNTYSDSRNTYYSISGFPTGVFDGTVNSVGGAACPSGNVYGTYLPLYNTEIATPSPLTICLSGSNSGNSYTINVVVTKLDNVSGSDLRLHLFLTESHISQSWQGCMTEVNFVTRLMVPGTNGTSFSFSSGSVQNFTLNFTKDASWNASNCELVAFVQDYPTKTIYNGIKCALTSLPSTLMTYTDFSGAPASGCAPLNTTFSVNASNVVNYNWTFPGGNPDSSTIQNPVVSYTDAGTNDVSLEVSNSICRESHTKTGYIVVNAIPAAPSTPQGVNQLCANPGSQTYTVPDVPSATSYTWQLTPSGAGTLVPNGSSCQVNYSSTFTGSATLKVDASNSCGTSSWSPGLSITISNPPAQPTTPSGPTSVCENTSSSDYTTSDVPNATCYFWDLNPGAAGNMTNNGSSITIAWTTGWTGSATLRVAAITTGCQGPWSNSLSITVNPLPQMFNVTGGGTYCAQGGSGMPVGLSGSVGGTNYTLYLNGTATSNTIPGNGSAISFGNQMTAGNYTVTGVTSTGSCSATMNGSATVAVDPQPPNEPGEPSGPDHVYTGIDPISQYTTTGGTYSTTYTWQLTPTAAGIVSGDSTTGTTTWNQAWSGMAKISVQGVNSCGGGTFSAEFQVTVEEGVGIMEKNQSRLVTILPNPARDQVRIIPLHAMKAKLQVSNSLGSVVISKDELSLSGEYKLDISGLAPGLYFISVNEKGDNQVLKLIVE